MIGRAFERALWASRLVVLVAAVVSVLLSVVMLLVASVDAFRLTGRVAEFIASAPPHETAYALRLAIVGNVIEVVDAFLLAAILLIFGMGLYELFIGKIDVAEHSAVAPRLLLIRSLDDLKSRLASVVPVDPGGQVLSAGAAAQVRVAARSAPARPRDRARRRGAVPRPPSDPGRAPA